MKKILFIINIIYKANSS